MIDLLDMGPILRWSQSLVLVLLDAIEECLIYESIVLALEEAMYNISALYWTIRPMTKGRPVEVALGCLC